MQFENQMWGSPYIIDTYVAIKHADPRQPSLAEKKQGCSCGARFGASPAFLVPTFFPPRFSPSFSFLFSFFRPIHLLQDQTVGQVIQTNMSAGEVCIEAQHTTVPRPYPILSDSCTIMVFGQCLLSAILLVSYAVMFVSIILRTAM